METLKGIWKDPEGKILLTFIAVIALAAVGEQVWWTNFAPKGTTRCVETVTGIVCLHKK
jgi:hypothetical protein